jgi:hypothetical protein
MAIIAPYNSDVGILLPEAYIKILAFNGDSTTITFDVGIYASKEAKEMGRPPVEHHYYTLPYTGDTISLLYDYLKTLPEFVGNVDA